MCFPVNFAKFLRTPFSHLGDCFWKIFTCLSARRLLKERAIPTLFAHSKDKQTQKRKWDI